MTRGLRRLTVITAIVCASPSGLQAGHGNVQSGYSSYRSVPAEHQTIWVPQLFLEGKPGSDRSIGTFDLVLPLTQDRGSLLFTDFRVRVDDQDSKEFNLGIGYRWAVNHDVILGVYGFFDVLRSANDNTILQATAGGEILKADWQLRANGYFPEDKRFDLGQTTSPQVAITGNVISLVSQSLTEQALTGFDVEFGRRLSDIFDQVWVYAGYFHYFEDGDFQEISGPRLRVQWTVPTDQLIGPGSRVTFGAQWQDDDVRDHQTFFSAMVRIPFGTAEHQRLEKTELRQSWHYWALQMPIRRDIDVVTGTATVNNSSPVFDPLTGEPYSSIYFASATGSGSGTPDDPANLNTAIALAGERGIVVAVGDDGDLQTEGITLLDGMSLVGGGTTISIATVGGVAVEDLTADQIQTINLSGTRPMIHGTGADLITITDGAGHVTIADVDLSGSTNTVIHANQNSNLTIRSITVDTPGGDALVINGVEDLDLSDVTITAATGRSLVLSNISGQNTIVSELDIIRSGGDGLTLTNGTGQITFNNITIQTDSAAGLILDNSGVMSSPSDEGSNRVTIDGVNSITATGGAALNAINTQLDATFSDITTTDSATGGVLLDGISGDLQITGATSVADAVEQGIGITNVTAADTQIQFGTVAIENVGDDAVRIDSVSGAGVDLAFGQIDIADTGGRGVIVTNVSGDSTTVRFSDVTQESVSGDGVRIDLISGQSIDVILGRVVIDDASARGVSLSNITGDGTLVQIGQVTMQDIVNDAVRIDAISGDRIDLTLGTVTIDHSDAQGVSVSNVTGEDGQITFGNVTVVDTTLTAVELSDITSDVRFGAVNVTESDGSGVVVNATSGNVQFGNMTINRVDDNGVDIGNVSDDIDLGQMTIQDVNGSGLVLNGVTASDTKVIMGDVTIVDANVKGILVTGLSANDIEVEFGDIEIDDVNEQGLLIDSVAGADFTMKANSIHITDADMQAVALINISGDGGDVLLDDIDIDAAGSQGILIDNLSGANFNLDTGDVQIVEPTQEGILVNNVSGNDVDIHFGDTAVTNPGATGFVETLTTGANVDIGFESFTED